MIFCLLVFTLRCTPSYLFAYTSNNYIYPLRSLLGILSFANISYSTLYSYISHREYSAYKKPEYFQIWTLYWEYQNIFESSATMDFEGLNICLFERIGIACCSLLSFVGDLQFYETIDSFWATWCSELEIVFIVTKISCYNCQLCFEREKENTLFIKQSSMFMSTSSVYIIYYCHLTYSE